MTFKIIVSILSFITFSCALSDYKFSSYLSQHNSCPGSFETLDLTKNEMHNEIFVVWTLYQFDSNCQIKPDFTQTVTIGSCTDFMVETDDLIVCEYTKELPYPQYKPFTRYRVSVACYNNGTLDYECKITYLDNNDTIRMYPFNMTKIERTTQVSTIMTTAQVTSTTIMPFTTTPNLAIILKPHNIVFIIFFFLFIV